MSSEDLKRVPMPITVRAYFLKIRKEGVVGGAGRSRAGSNVSGGLDATAPEAPEEPADPYEWMHTHLARLLPESMQSNEVIWNGTISALKAADVRSAEQLDAMTTEDLKKANVPLLVCALLLKIRKSGENVIPRAILLSQGAEGGEGKEEKTDQMKPVEAEVAAAATADKGPPKDFQNIFYVTKGGDGAASEAASGAEGSKQELPASFVGCGSRFPGSQVLEIFRLTNAEREELVRGLRLKLSISENEAAALLREHQVESLIVSLAADIKGADSLQRQESVIRSIKTNPLCIALIRGPALILKSQISGFL